MNRPKVAFFDLNHTVLQMTDIPGEEVAAYLSHIRQLTYKPLTLPDSWRRLDPWSEVAAALLKLSCDLNVKVVTLSNNPIDVQIDQTRHAMLEWDWMIPLEMYKVFKPRPSVYHVACDLLKVKPQDALMITANKDFGDIEGATLIGMPSVWIDRKNEDPNHPIKNLMDLVKEME